MLQIIDDKYGNVNALNIVTLSEKKFRENYHNIL